MKTYLIKILLSITLLLGIAFYTSCNTDDGNDSSVVDEKQHLVKQAVSTYASSGNRYVTDYIYDNDKRLIGYGGGVYKFSYNAGGLLISYDDTDYHLAIQFSLNNGRVNTIKYSVQQGTTRTEFLSTFFYDDKGRLARIFNNKLNLPNGYAWTNNYLYTWDDNDNLTEEKIELSRKPDGTVESTFVVKYSEFDAKNVNTLAASNFGFNYFGLYSYPTLFRPTSDGSSLQFLQPAFSGKLLPSKITEGYINMETREYDVTYQKNEQNLITRIDQKDK
ncbi:MAG: hypothetical protein RSE50_10990, partial [Myroides sp.]